ncbi:MAG: hypothetical protein HY231_08760 [Acidobacteria bacterium]|nr:hypothetical protein [Acidobacteriota bacterium]
MSTLRNWIEKISTKIPGYSGYIDKEGRRDTDKRHRENLANRLRASKTPLTDFMRELTNSGRLFEVTPIDTALKKLDKIENRVRYATYGYGGFFDAVKIEEAQLDAIYRFDLSLVEQTEKIEAEVAEVKAQGGTSDGLKTAAAQLISAIDAFDRAFDERYKAINDFNPEQPQGRPLFG